VSKVPIKHENLTCVCVCVCVCVILSLFFLFYFVTPVPCTKFCPICTFPPSLCLLILSCSGNRIVELQQRPQFLSPETWLNNSATLYSSPACHPLKLLASWMHPPPCFFIPQHCKTFSLCSGILKSCDECVCV